MSIPNRKKERKYNNFIPVDQTEIIKASFQMVLLIESETIYQGGTSTNYKNICPELPWS